MSPDSPYYRFAAGSSCRPIHYIIMSTLLFPVVLSFTGCAGISAGKSLTTTTTSTTTPTVLLAPATVSLYSGDQQQFVATVTNTGDTAVTWSVNQGTITPAGLFTAPPVSSVTAVHLTATCVTNSNVQAEEDVTVVPLPVLSITTTTIGSATAGVAYSNTLTASGGALPYTWEGLSGNLPAGIQLNGSTGVVAGTTGQSGQFTFTVQVTDASSSPQTASVTLALTVQPTGTQRVTAQFFGLHINRRTAGMVMPTIPFGSYRTIDSFGTLWNGIETSPGVYDFSALDARLADAQAAGVDVLYTVYSPPSFHSSKPADSTCGTGLGACDAPSDVNADGSGTDQSLISFLTALVNHVGNKIAYYEMWNEVNINSEWTGTDAQLVRMAHDMRTVILPVNPNAKMLSPSFASLTYTSAANRFAAYLSTSVDGTTGSEVADIINIHGYVDSPAWPVPLAENEVLNVNNLRAVLSSTDLAKPLWDTEWGYSNGLADPDLNAAFVAKHTLIQAGQGVARAFYYDWDPKDQRALWSNTLTACLNSGTASAGGYLCEAGTTYQQVESWLSGNTAVQACSGPMPPAMGVWTCRLLTPNGTQTLAVWDSSKTCAAGVCTSSSYSYDPRYTRYFTLANDVSTPLSGGTVAIGAKPILLSQ